MRNWSVEESTPVPHRGILYQCGIPLRGAENPLRNFAEFDMLWHKEVRKLPKSFRVKIWDNCGIPEELRRYCRDHNESVNAFVNKAIAEKLERMDVHSMTIAEIEGAERGE